MHRFLRAVLVAIALVSGDVQAAGWFRCGSTTITQNTIDNSRCSTWTETGTADSGLLIVETATAKIVNTGSTDWTIWDADCATGTKANVWWSTQDGASCGPLATTDDCGSTEVVEGCYVIDPDATGGSATVKGSRSSSDQ